MSGLDTVYLDTVLRPNPPASPALLKFILLVVAAINIAFATWFLFKGAWPIAPFMGADVALLCWAFRASRLAARAYERITVTMSRLSVLRHPARGPDTTTVLNPYWVSVSLTQPEDMPRNVFLRSHGKTIQIGGFLGPRERLCFAQALKTALRSARSARFN
jgi:uncharacterized membrane protein